MCVVLMFLPAMASVTFHVASNKTDVGNIDWSGFPTICCDEPLGFICMTRYKYPDRYWNETNCA
jgi:hypothetical protein